MMDTAGHYGFHTMATTDSGFIPLMAEYAIPRVKIRGFEVAKGFEDKGIRLPEMSTEGSAGYDFFAPYDVVVPAMNHDFEFPTLVPTGVKAYMRPDEFLLLANRSSNGKLGLILSNSIGIVDYDFAGNPTDDGHIRFSFWNISDADIVIKKGQKIGQGIFQSFLRADVPKSTNKRTGGWGSTGV